MTDAHLADRREALYAEHFRARREAAEHAVGAAGYDRLLIHSGSSHARFQDDYHPPFRAHPHFVAWLPLPRNPDGLLEVRPGHRPRLWLARPDDFWHAPPTPPEDWWAQHYEIEIVDDPGGWRDALKVPEATALIGDGRDFGRGDGLGTAGARIDLNPEALLLALDEQRTVKTDWQIECIAEANRIAVAGHRAAADAFAAGESELGIHLAYLAAAGHDPDTLPYNSIVALNEHAAVLHYQYREAAKPREHRSFLIDAGADCYGLAADITRTWTLASGPFADLIGQMDQHQQRLAASMQVGRDYVDLHRQAHRNVAEVLREAQLCDMSIEAMVESGLTATFLPHGLGHFLGVQVHDVAGHRAPDGAALPPPQAHPALRLTRRLAAGNVLTVEPGLYFIGSLLARLRASPLAGHIDWAAIEALQAFGGIRIEDDVVVALETPRNLTREAWAAADG